MYIRKRLFALTISFLLFAILILGGYLYLETGKTARSAAAEGYGYQRDIANLASSLDKISDGLQKAVYAATPYRSAALAAEILAQAEGARTALSSLPTYELMLTRTNEFLSRVGDYSTYLTRKAINGGEVSAEEKENLLSLARSAAELAAEVAEIEERVISENMDADAISALFAVPEGYWSKSIETAAGEALIYEEAPNEFIALEEIFPTSAFNYDGKFSDHLKSLSSDFLNSREAVTEAEAKEKAAAVLGIAQNDLILTGDVGTKSAKCYIFSPEDGSFTVYITKQGGFLHSYSATAASQEQDFSLTGEEAEARAEGFLSACGYSGCEKTYWKYQDDRLLLTYVTVKNGVRIYPEEIKVAVSLADGKVVYCDASAYLTALNRDRSLSFGSVTEDEAIEKISADLLPQTVTKAVIPSQGGRELYCYEILCQAADGTRIVVYINSQDGAEEESLILSENEEGYSAR